MKIDKLKLAYALSAVWALISIPMSEVIYDDVIEESGFLMRFFALLLVLAPVWIVLGWRWMTNNRPIPAKLWLGVSAVAILIALGFASDSYIHKFTGIPVLALVFFLLLVWTFERGDMLWWRKRSLDQVLPTPSDFKDGIGKLVDLTEDLSNEILDELRRLAPDLKLPFPVHASDSLACAYGLIYCSLLGHGFGQKGSKAVAIFAGYKSMVITNYVSIMVPKVPGSYALTDAATKAAEVREPVKKLLEMKEEAGDTVRDNLARNAANPFYPFYGGMRAYVAKDATTSDLNATFDSVFSSWNGKAKRRVESLLRQIA